LAEGIFLNEAEKQGLLDFVEADSAGTSGQHEGELPDPRTRKNALDHGLKLSMRARKFKNTDFDAFDQILVMDKRNLEHVLNMSRNASDELKVSLFREFDPIGKGEDVPDPWYGEEEGFEAVYQITHRTVVHFLEDLRKKM
jgi:protein-tyrosine phosphatase